jgi:hypothetical protein
MKKADVKVGMVYLCKVGRQVTEVRLDSENPYGGWNGTNVKTHRRIRVKSAQRLRALSGLTRAAARQDEGSAPGAPQAQETAKAKKTGLLDAAILVLREAGQPMNTKEMVEAVLAKDLWKSDGKTPAATLYSSILREIQKKGDEARFRKTERGRFELKS